MNGAVLLLPLVQLWVSTHKLLNALRIKALALIRSKLGCARPAADDPSEAEGDEQVSSRCICSNPSLVDIIDLILTFLSIADRCSYAVFRPRLHRLMLFLSKATRMRSASNTRTDFSRGIDASAEHTQLAPACAADHAPALHAPHSFGVLPLLVCLFRGGLRC